MKFPVGYLVFALAAASNIALCASAYAQSPASKIEVGGDKKVDSVNSAATKTSPGKAAAATAKSAGAKPADAKPDVASDDVDWDLRLETSKKLYAAGKLNESANELDLALATAERLKIEPSRADAYLRLGEQYLYLHQFEKAKALMEEGLRLKKKIPGFKSVQTANAQDNLAQAYSRIGDLDNAAKMELEALETYQSLHKTDTHDYAIALSNHANTLRALKQYKDSEQFFAKAVAVQQKAEKEDGVELAKILLNAGGLYCEMNKLDSAKRLLDRASKIVHTKLSPEHPLYKLSIKSERVYCKKKVDSLLKKDPNPIRPDVAQAVQNLAALYDAEDDANQASAAYKQAIGIQEKLLPADSPELQKLKDAYTACLKKLTN